MADKGDSEANILAATRIAAGDDRARYDALSIVLHWTTALLVLLLFGLAELWGYFPKPERYLLVVGHISFGLVLIFVLGLRIVWRLTPGHKVRDAGTGIIGQAAKAVHYVLYLLLAGQAIFGILTRFTDNKALTFFGLQIPSPFGAFSKATGGFVDQIHNITAWLIIGLVSLHVLAALFHHFVVRDDTLTRMLPRRQKL